NCTGSVLFCAKNESAGRVTWRGQGPPASRAPTHFGVSACASTAARELRGCDHERDDPEHDAGDGRLEQQRDRGEREHRDVCPGREKAVADRTPAVLLHPATIARASTAAADPERGPGP
ncbi:MAG: hypothetical protein QOI55_1994, partial [Actinomycetota bacterium]|nr:hypothetical protein [Actinomycetota bacterium]